MTTKSIKECLDIEKFTPVLEGMYVPLQISKVGDDEIWSKGWLGTFLKTEWTIESFVIFNKETSVIPRELML